MKTIQIIISIIMITAFTSCLSKYYKVSTQIDRNGSARKAIQTTTANADSIAVLFPYDISHGWEILQTDTVVEEYSSLKNRKNITISKKIKSLNDLSADLREDIIFPVATESLEKHFRWFYTYYDFTAIYPELTNKGRVPIDAYLTDSEQAFYFQGDQSAYRGMNGIELKEALDDIESRIREWYDRSMYEEFFDVIMHYTAADFRPKLPAVKDTLYSILEKQNLEDLNVKDVCLALNEYFGTDLFSRIHNENEREMNNMIDERKKVSDSLFKYSIQYALAMPGKIVTANSDLQDGGTLIWKIDLYRFLADNYALTAQSRTMNLWAFAVTLLLIIFSIYCFIKKPNT